MCGSYELKAKARELTKRLPLLQLDQAAMPHAVEMQPAKPVLMITAHGAGYAASKARWGLVGRFLDREPRNPPIHLPGEGLVAKPFYSKILRQNRCLIPATAFYESPRRFGRSPALRVSDPRGKVLMFAGIFDHHPLAGTTCAIITSAADQTSDHIDERIPRILDRDESIFWLSDYEEFPDEAFETLLQAPSQQALAMEAVIEEEPSPQLSLAFA